MEIRNSDFTRLARRMLEAFAFALLWIAEHLDKGEGMDVEVTRRDVNGNGIEAKVITGDVAIVAQKRGFADWEALYGEKNGSKIDLPSCFSLNAESIKALEAESGAA